MARKTSSRADSPNESTNRAYSIAEDLLTTYSSYCNAPTDPADIGRDFSSLLNEISAAQDRLRLVRHERAHGTFAKPQRSVLDAIDSVERLAVKVHVRTQVQLVAGTEVGLQDLRQSLGRGQLESE